MYALISEASRRKKTKKNQTKKPRSRLIKRSAERESEMEIDVWSISHVASRRILLFIALERLETIKTHNERGKLKR